MVRSLEIPKSLNGRRVQSNHVSPFVGHLWCADCGAWLCSVQRKRMNKAGEDVCYISFMCNTHAKGVKPHVQIAASVKINYIGSIK